MEILDAQIHEPHAGVTWGFGEESELALHVELAREAMDCVGVDGGLVNARPEFCAAVTERYPERFASCPFADLGVEDVDHYVATVRDTPGQLALRVVIRTYRDGKLTPAFLEGRHERIFAAAEHHGLPIFMQAAGHMGSALEIAAAHPELTLIVDHLGLNQQPSAVADDPWADLDTVLELARFPSVAIKFCGGPTLARDPYPYPDIWPHLHRMIDAFGPQRLLWGSDYTRLRIASSGEQAPRSAWYGSYAEQVHFIRDSDELSADDKEQILGAALRRTLNWPAPEAS